VGIQAGVIEHFWWQGALAPIGFLIAFVDYDLKVFFQKK
jgi:hypothetical protein